MRLDGIHVGYGAPGLLKCACGRRDRCFRHESQFRARRSEAKNFDHDAGVGAEFPRSLGGRHDDRGVAVGRVGLSAEGDRSLLTNRPEFSEPVRGGNHDALIAIDGFRDFLVVGRWHSERQAHVTFLKSVLVGQGILILRLAMQHQFMLFLCADAVLAGDVFRGIDHRMSAQWIATEVVHHPVFGRPRAAGRLCVGVIKVRAVGGPVAGDRQRRCRKTGFDLLHSRQQYPRAGGASLVDGRACDMTRSQQAHKPG